ncbi:hypothetical protein EK0264_12555 [Epidermidibacterium keratini]|uniref:Small secreted hydrophilic protein n=1 Tax=Epidermidibacterium keratini TaxID=1891644 RepID=A0A7L4YPQ2_9ACTN|nr:hypothetical protein [Epidermidibacterium keratini]QHC01038.1 hypothetical protein EK0264_12555 [Epidermidibacterium keratini]
MPKSGLRILVLLGVLAVPVLLALAAQAIAARPGAPDVQDRAPVSVHVEPAPSSTSSAPGEPTNPAEPPPAPTTSTAPPPAPEQPTTPPPVVDVPPQVDTQPAPPPADDDDDDADDVDEPDDD